MRQTNNEPRVSSTSRIPQAMRDQATRRMGGSGAVLSKLFGKMVCDMGYENLSKWNTLMHRYLTDRRNAIPQNKKDMSSARGNLHKELMKGHMSWNVFNKGMRFIDLKGYEITITAHHRDGSTSTTSETVGLGERVEYSASESPLAQIEMMPGDSIAITVQHPRGTHETYHQLCTTEDMTDLDALSLIFTDPELDGFEAIVNQTKGQEG